ncbi:MAG: NAD(P)/FAD-dependent oxidoreductase [bacterium]|nr:NAD(P)/FAD-dependent oxidoreductase [bacterium]
MHIAIVGAGFTGLSAGFALQKQGHMVTIFEQETIPGGLAIGFQQPKWDWSLEKHYHHIFTSDTAIRALSEEIGVPFHFMRPNTSSLIDDEIIQLDSPVKLLQFHAIPFIDRVRMGAVLAYLKYIANWQKLEQFTAHDWLQKAVGKVPYGTLWEPLLKAKFGSYYKDISLAWFWARIKARTTQLGYPEGGFQHFSQKLADTVNQAGGIIHYNSIVTKIEKLNSSIHITHGSKTELFDRVIVTVPNGLFARMTPTLPREYIKKLTSFKGIGAVNMVLELDAPFLKDDVYWLNMCDREYPFLAVVEHTNFIPKEHYNGTHILYVGNYLSHDHPYFRMNKEDLLKEYHPYLEKLHPGYSKHVLKTHIFHAPFAQPIVTKNFSQNILPFETPLVGIYLANMQQVYPWDRGTNFAVELGQRVAGQIV